MQNKLIFSLLFGIFLSSIYPQAHAQEQSSKNSEIFDPQQGSSELRSIKENLQALLKENKELEAQAESLKKEYLNLKNDLAHAKAQTVNLEQAQKASETKEADNLKQLQLYDLQYQKKDLELELRLKEISLGEKQKDFDSQLAQLQKELDKNTEEETKVISQIEEFKKNTPALSEIETLRQENLELERQLNAKDPSFKGMGRSAIFGLDTVSIKDLQSKKNSGPIVSLLKEIQQKENQRDQLQQKVKQLEIKKQLPGGSDLSTFEGNFVEAVTNLDEENQRLRSKLFSLRGGL